MKWLLQRMLCEIEDINPYSPTTERIIEKYAKMAEIQAKVYGDVFTIEDFIDDVKRGCIMSYDGCGYYWDDEESEEVSEVSLDIDILKEKANEYKYVIWYNK